MLNKIPVLDKGHVMKQITGEDIEKLPHRFQVCFALFCAKQVVHLTDSKEAHKCIEVVEKYLEGKASKEECKHAANATYATGYAVNAAAYAANAAADAAANAVANAAYAAAYATANAAANAAYAAANAAAYAAANATTKQKVIKEQWNYYNELLNFDSIFEMEVLC